MSTLAFDIETVPDVDGYRRLHGLDGLDDSDVARIMLHQRRQEAGTEFVRLHLHRVVAISCVLRRGDDLQVWSLGEEDSDERELVGRFFDGIARLSPTLVSWNGSGFDLPVLNYRALLHGVQAARYWETGDSDQSFRWSNYLSRYHWRHVDLMDVLAGFQPRANAPLDDLAQLLGAPGKLGMDGSLVWDAWQEGRIKEIRDYCETDALNTWLVHLRFEHMRGNMDAAQLAQEAAKVREVLQVSGHAHLQEFLDAWDLERYLKVADAP